MHPAEKEPEKSPTVDDPPSVIRFLTPKDTKAHGRVSTPQGGGAPNSRISEAEPGGEVMFLKRWSGLVGGEPANPKLLSVESLIIDHEKTQKLNRAGLVPKRAGERGGIFCKKRVHPGLTTSCPLGIDKGYKSPAARRVVPRKRTKRCFGTSEAHARGLEGKNLNSTAQKTKNGYSRWGGSRSSEPPTQRHLNNLERTDGSSGEGREKNWDGCRGDAGT